MEFQRSKSHWLSFQNSCISVFETQAAPFDGEIKSSLFFLHGRFGHAEMWHPLIEELCGHFRCFSVDFPGFGRSFLVRNRAFSLLEHTTLINELVLRFIPEGEKVILVGHDVGGGIAQLCTLKLSEKIAALVLINSVALTQALSKIGTGWQGWGARWRLHLLLAEAKTMHSEFKNSLVSPWESNKSRKALLNSIRALDESWPWHYERQSWRHAIQNISQPILLLWGKKDSFNQLAMGIEIVQNFPEVYFFVHEDSGHWPPLEQPEWVLCKMKEFIFKTKFGVCPRSVRKSLLK